MRSTLRNRAPMPADRLCSTAMYPLLGDREDIRSAQFHIHCRRTRSQARLTITSMFEAGYDDALVRRTEGVPHVDVDHSPIATPV